MQAVCDILEQLLEEETITRYAIGGATAAGFHGEPLATGIIDVLLFLELGNGSSASMGIRSRTKILNLKYLRSTDIPVRDS